MQGAPPGPGRGRVVVPSLRPLLLVPLLALAVLAMTRVSLVTLDPRAPSRREAALASWHRGVNFVDDGAAYDSEDALEALARLEALSVEWLCFTPSGSQPRLDRPEIRFEEPAGRDLVRGIRMARARGFRAMVSPYLWSEEFHEGKWRGDIRMADDDAWRRWFEEYSRFLLANARAAEEAGAEIFSIGIEYAAASTGRPEDWRTLIAEVRNVFHGALTYSANWDREYDRIPFWDDLDFIGVNAYFPLSDSGAPPPESLDAGWERRFAALDSVRARFRKPVLFTEVGYKSTPAPWRRPWDWGTDGHGTDLAAQDEAFRSFFRVASGVPWFRGAYVWKFFTSPDWGGPSDNDFTPQGKPAARTIGRWFAWLADARPWRSPEGFSLRGRPDAGIGSRRGGAGGGRGGGACAGYLEGAEAALRALDPTLERAAEGRLEAAAGEGPGTEPCRVKAALALAGARMARGDSLGFARAVSGAVRSWADLNPSAREGIPIAIPVEQALGILDRAGAVALAEALLGAPGAGPLLSDARYRAATSLIGAAPGAAENAPDGDFRSARDGAALRLLRAAARSEETLPLRRATYLRALGRAELASADTSGALRAFARALDLVPPTADPSADLERIGDLALAAGDGAAAARAFVRLLEISREPELADGIAAAHGDLLRREVPERFDRTVRFRGAARLLEAGNLPEGRAAFDSLAGAGAEEGEPLARRAKIRALLAAGVEAGPAASIAALRELEGEWAETLEGEEAGRVRAGLESLTRRRAERARDPGSLDALKGEAWTYWRMGLLARAARAFEEAALRAPGDEDAPHFLGHVYERLKRYDLMRATIEPLAARDPANAHLALLLASAALGEGDHRSARATAERVLATRPRASEPHYILGAALLAAGERTRARTEFRKYLATEPDGRYSREARRALALLANVPG